MDILQSFSRIAMLSIPPPESRLPPDIGGLHVSADEWRLDTTRYAAFIELVTGIRPTEHLNAADCYRIGNRLEGFVEERKREGEWNAALVADLPDVESLDEIVALARFFRHCHDCRLEQ
jgi:hypothetical protein